MRPAFDIDIEKSKPISNDILNIVHTPRTAGEPGVEWYESFLAIMMMYGGVYLSKQDEVPHVFGIVIGAVGVLWLIFQFLRWDGGSAQLRRDRKQLEALDYEKHGEIFIEYQKALSCENPAPIRFHESIQALGREPTVLEALAVIKWFRRNKKSKGKNSAQ